MYSVATPITSYEYKVVSGYHRTQFDTNLKEALLNGWTFFDQSNFQASLAAGDHNTMAMGYAILVRRGT